MDVCLLFKVYVFICICCVWVTCEERMRRWGTLDLSSRTIERLCRCCSFVEKKKGCGGLVKVVDIGILMIRSRFRR